VGEVFHDPAAVPGLQPAAVAGCRTLHQLLNDYRRRADEEPLVDVVADLIQKIRYQDEINRLYKEPNDQIARWNAVEEVVNALGSYAKRAKKPTVSGFLDEIALAGRDDEKDKESQLARNAIALMTLHSAKGLEFPHVYLVGMEEGLLPHHRSIAAEGLAIDEERRLCYVGVTRARDRLTLSLALSRNKWGKSRPTIASRFLFELLGKADNPQALAARSKSEKLARGDSTAKSKAKTPLKRRPAVKGTVKPGTKGTRPPKRR